MQLSRLLLWLVVLALTLPVILRTAEASTPASATAPAFPRYEAASCCQLCPQASDQANYNTRFLDSFKTLVQGSEGWLFRSEADLQMTFGPTPEGLQRLSRFHRALRQRGVELVVVVQPPRGLMHADKLRSSGYPYDPREARASYELTLTAVRSLGIVTPKLEDLLDTRGDEDYFWRTDHHWTPDGARRTARLVADAILQIPVYASLRRQAFVTRREGVLARGGTLSHAVSELCGFGGPKQYVTHYITEPLEGEGDAGLLGEDAVPEITLVGTSNSGPSYNFSGFLSDDLRADVLNASVVGGGMDGAMLSYLPSAEFHRHPPKVLIWELQHFHNLGDPLFYRQAMPLLDDGCNGRHPVLDHEVALRKGANEVLFNGGGTVRALKGRDYLLDIQFSDPSVRELRAVVWYTSGTKDTLRIEQSEHAPSQEGRFVAELRSDLNWGEQTFMGLDVEVVPPEPEPGTTPPASELSTGPHRVRARLCSKADLPAISALRASMTEARPP